MGRKHLGATVFLVALLAGALAIVLAACGGEKPAEAPEDVLTQKVTQEGRTPITVLVKYAFGINTFEQAVEEKFPDVDIIQVGNYTRDMGKEEYVKRMENGDLPDMVMTWPLEVGKEHWSERLVDLSGMAFTNNYNLSMLDAISQDGALYYVPGPSQVRGIVYNKTLFQENGWQVPEDFQGFVDLCHEIEAEGIRALQLGLKNGEVLDTAFVGFGYADCFSRPSDAQWIQEYNRGEHSFGDHFTPALETFQRLVDEEILRPEDLDRDYADRESMLFSRRCAMVEDSVLLTRMGGQQAGSTDEFALMPFFNPHGGGDWGRLYMVCYIGLNQELTQPQNREKYELVLRLMEYISTPEGQEALMGDTGAMFSSVKGVGAPDIPEIETMMEALNSGRYAIFPELENAQQALREGLAGMVAGELDKDQVIAMVDEQNRNPPLALAQQVFGVAKEDFTLMETGNYICDVLREETGSDVALFLDNGKDGLYNGKGVSGKLYRGDLTRIDVMRVLPDLKTGDRGVLCTAGVTGENLIKILEYAIPVNNNVDGWFYYASGLRMEYAPAAQPGSRIRSITDAEGEPIDPQRVYTVTSMDKSLPQELLQDHVESDLTIAQCLEKAIMEAGTISPAKDGRFQVAAP